MEDAIFEALLEPILELYSQIEIELLCNVAERFDTYDTVGGTLEWYMKMLQETGAFKNDNARIIQEYAGLTAKEMKHLLQEVALMTSMKEVEADYNALMNSAANRHTLESIERNLLDDINVINTKALESTEKAYMSTLTKAYIKTSSGAFSYQESIKSALVEMANSGIAGATYQRNSGQIVRYNLEATIRRDVLTRVNQTAVEVQFNNMHELGCNLVYVSQHMGARVHPTNKIANHAGWQGKVYMLDGSSDKYQNLVEATGYGDIRGLAGVNCRHHISSYVEGVTKLPTHIDEEENERIYKLSQEQRKLERDIRKAKKRLAVAKQMGDKDLQKQYRAQLDDKTEKLNDFVIKHKELKRDYARTRVVYEYKNGNKLAHDIPDGLSRYDSSKNSEYDKLLATTPPENIFERYPAKSANNPYNEDLTFAEIDFVKRAKLFVDEIELIPLQSGRRATNDFRIIGKQWELKTPTETSETIIRNTIWKITDQGKRNAILDVTYLDRNMKWIIDKVENHLAIAKNSRALDNLLIVRGNKFIQMK